MTVVEEVVPFDAGGAALVGILSRPATPPAGVDPGSAVLVVVGGPQYRVGSHRQFVLLARALAAGGHTVLRFDFRGMGDSEGEAVDFEHAVPDIGAAAHALLRRAPAGRRLVLWGLCDGASAALLYLYATSDARVAGVCLLNPWVRSEATLARTHVKHYYLQRLGQPEFWRKLLRGQVAVQALKDLLQNLGRALGAARPARAGAAVSPRRDDLPFQQRMALALAEFRAPVALLLSGNDYTAKEFIEHAAADALWRKNLGSDNLERFDFESADHTFSGRDAQRQLEVTTLAWLGRIAAAPKGQGQRLPSEEKTT